MKNYYADKNIIKVSSTVSSAYGLAEFVTSDVF